MKIIYFSPTGNVRYLADQLGKELGLSEGAVVSMESYSAGDIAAGGFIDNQYTIVMYPIHAFNAPVYVKKLIKMLPSGNGQKIALLACGCVKADINSAATFDVRKMLLKKGYSITFERLFAMPLTIVTSFPEKLCKKLITDAGKDIQETARIIRENTEVLLKPKLSARILRKISIIERAGARMLGLELYANKQCTSCGICVKNCPAGNIRFNKKNKPRFGFKCYMCLRCVYDCPEKAIKPRISRFVLIKGGYDINRYIEK